MGKDHTIFALEKGFVKYYRDPERGRGKKRGSGGDGGRKFIGVVFERGMSLPRGRGERRRRRLGMEEVVVGVEGEMGGEESGSGDGEVDVDVDGGNAMTMKAKTTTLPPTKTNTNTATATARATVTGFQPRTQAEMQTAILQQSDLQMRAGYMYRESNWSIGRAAERAGVKFRMYEPKDRFRAWRKTTARKARAALRRGLRKR